MKNEELMAFVSVGGFFAIDFAFAAVVALIGLWLLGQLNEDRGKAFFWILVATTICGIAEHALSSRNLQLSYADLQMEGVAKSSGGRLPIRILLATISGISLAVMISYVTGKRRSPTSPQIANVQVGLAALFLASGVLPAAYAENPSFSLGLIYGTPIILVLILAHPNNPKTAISAVKSALSLIIISSLLAAIFLPNVAVQTGYSGVVPSFNIRLWGLTTHANVLGSVSVTLLVIELSRPVSKSWLSYAIMGMSAISIGLSQSKAAAVAGLISLITIALYRSAGIVSAGLKIKNQADRRATAVTLSLIVVAMMICAAALAVWMTQDFLGTSSGMDRLMDRINLDSASGRTEIWKTAIQEFNRNPVVGYGLEIWGVEYRIAHSLYSAFHAHNQFLQVAATSGLIGLVPLVGYYIIFGYVCFKERRSTKGASLAFLLVLVWRSIFEVPLQFGAFYQGEFLAHIAVLAYLVAVGRESAEISGTAPKPWIRPASIMNQ